jgi:hypothetical protein
MPIRIQHLENPVPIERLVRDQPQPDNHPLNHV